MQIFHGKNTSVSSMFCPQKQCSVAGISGDFCARESRGSYPEADVFFRVCSMGSILIIFWVQRI